MPLTLYYHPFASFCQKVLIALYETGTAFEPRLVDLSNPQDRAAFAAVWPIAKFPVLHDPEQGLTLPESSVVIEWVHRHAGSGSTLIPDDPDLALEVRLWDRFFDNYIHVPMQKLGLETMTPEGMRDLRGVESARSLLATAYDVLETRMAGRTWVVGDRFTMADCAAGPPLWYASMYLPLDAHPNIAAYLRRLIARPSFARAIDEARPYRHFFPLKDAHWPDCDPAAI